MFFDQLMFKNTIMSKGQSMEGRERDKRQGLPVLLASFINIRSRYSLQLIYKCLYLRYFLNLLNFSGDVYGNSITVLQPRHKKALFVILGSIILHN